jgi:diguanylate cyclase (GGDEF)-like protein
MQIAAEVARLEFELAVARAQMVDLAARAETDLLTDLPNRRGFERELKRSLAFVKRYGASAALLYIDLDAFKAVNDRHGHAAGDAVLRAVAMVLARHVRDSDLVARIGGDEFVLLLWNCTEADAQLKAEAIEGAITRTTATHAGQSLSVGASCGAVTLLPLDQPAGALERADHAMYARKAWRNDRRAAAGA